MGNFFSKPSISSAPAPASLSSRPEAIPQQQQQILDQPNQQLGYGSHQTSNGNSSARSGGPSFMSQSQQQRRKETAKYVSDRINLSPDWPGFGSSPTYLAQDTSNLRSLWDDQQSPLVSASDNIWSQAGLWTDMGMYYFYFLEISGVSIYTLYKIFMYSI